MENKEIFLIYCRKFKNFLVEIPQKIKKRKEFGIILKTFFSTSRKILKKFWCGI